VRKKKSGLQENEFAADGYGATVSDWQTAMALAMGRAICSTNGMPA
jgi:hypothetical protein